MNKAGEKTIDLRDLLVEVLFRWKAVLLITLAVTVAAAGVGFLRDRQERIAAGSAQKELTEEDVAEQEQLLVEKARGKLTDAEAKDVERIYRQYTSYIEYRNLFQQELASYDKAFDGTGEEMLVGRTTYRLTSSVEGAGNLMTTYAMDIDDYRQIVGALPDVETLSAAYKHVYFTNIAGNETEVTNMGEPETILPSQYLIVVEVIGNTREVCEDVSKITDNALQRQLAELRKIDPDADLDRVSSNYRGNIYEYFIQKKQTTFDNIQKVDTVINNLKTYSIDKMNNEQAAYFSALRDPERSLVDKGLFTVNELSGEENQSAPASSVKKLAVLGVLAGLVLSLLYVLVRYTFSGMINAEREVQAYYHLPVLSTFFIRGGRAAGLFPGLIRRLLHVDSTESETKAAMVAADTCGAMEQSDGESIYLLQTFRCVNDTKIASMIGKAVREYSPSTQVFSGEPLVSVDEMHRLTRQKNALLLIHSKKTLRADVEKLLDFCGRHEIRVLGTVLVTDL